MSRNPPLLPRREADSGKNHSAGGLTGMLSMWKLGELTWRKLLRRTWCQFWEDRILDQSAKLSFYFLLSFFPLLLFLIALLGLLLQIVSLVLMASALLLMIYGGRWREIMVSTFGFGSFIAGVWRVLQWPLLLGFVLMAFNILYLYAPDVKHRRWHWLMPGTVVSARPLDAAAR